MTEKFIMISLNQLCKRCRLVKISKIYSGPFAVLIFLLNTQPAACQFKQWGSLKSGPYAIGFKVLTVTDSSRVYADFAPPFAKDLPYRQIPLFVWYPAERGKTIMKYGDYFQFLKYESLQSATTRDDLLSQLKKGWDITEEEFARASQEPIPVYKDGIPIREKFPVVLHTHATGLLMQTILSEFLASNGFIVISYPRLGVSPLYFNWNDNSTKEEIASADDAGFIISKLITIVPYAAIDQVSFIGMLAEKGINYQFKNSSLKAVACVGCFADERIKQMPYYDNAKFRIPVLQIVESWRNDMPLFIDSLINAPRWTIKMKHLEHTNLYPLPGIFGNSPEINTKYEYLANATLEFLDAVIKDDLNSFTLKSIPKDSILSFAFRKPQEYLPSETEYLSWLKSGDLKKLAENKPVGHKKPSARKLRELLSIVASQGRSYLADEIKLYFNLYPEDPKENFIYIYRNAATTETALRVFEIVRQRFPDSAYPYDSISEYYEFAKNNVMAKKFAIDGLKLLEKNPDKNNSQLKELETQLHARLTRLGN
jgi:hypothetical protein